MTAGLRMADIDAPFLSECHRRRGGAAPVVVAKMAEIPSYRPQFSNLSRVTNFGKDKSVGQAAFNVEYAEPAQTATLPRKLLVKLKPTDRDVFAMITALASACSAELGGLFQAHASSLELSGCHLREIDVYDLRHPLINELAPRIFGTYRDDTREAYVVVMELLEGAELMNSVASAGAWTRPHVEAAIAGIAPIHAAFYDTQGPSRSPLPALRDMPSTASMAAKTDLWEALADYLARSLPELLRPSEQKRYRRLASTVGAWWQGFSDLGKTLIHNDFGPRNLAFRASAAGLKLCAYDWELAAWHVPQHDLAELLSYCLMPSASAAEVSHFLEFHRRSLEQLTGRHICRQAWRQGYLLSLQHLAIERHALSLMAHTVKGFDYLLRVTKTMQRLLDIEEQLGTEVRR